MARFRDFIEGELRPFIARIEAFGPEVHGVGAVGDRRAYRVERASWREEFGNAGHRRNLTHSALRVFSALRDTRWFGFRLSRSAERERSAECEAG